jgi:hypothetical protein
MTVRTPLQARFDSLLLANKPRLQSPMIGRLIFKHHPKRSDLLFCMRLPPRCTRCLSLIHNYCLLKRHECQNFEMFSTVEQELQKTKDRSAVTQTQLEAQAYSMAQEISTLQTRLQSQPSPGTNSNCISFCKDEPEKLISCTYR